MRKRQEESAASSLPQVFDVVNAYFLGAHRLVVPLDTLALFVAEQQEVSLADARQRLRLLRTRVPEYCDIVLSQGPRPGFTFSKKLLPGTLDLRTLRQRLEVDAVLASLRPR